MAFNIFLLSQYTIYKIYIRFKKKNILKEWSWTGIRLYTLKKKKIQCKYIGKRGNNDICKYLIKGKIKVNYNSTVTDIKFNSKYWIVTLNNKDQVYFKYLILTCPFPQLKKLSFVISLKKISNLKVQMSPNITVMAGL